MSTSTWTVYENMGVRGILHSGSRKIECTIHGAWVTESDHGYKIQSHKHDKALDFELHDFVDAHKSIKRVYTRTDSNVVIS